MMSWQRAKIAFCASLLCASFGFQSNASLAQTNKPLPAEVMQHLDKDKFTEIKLIKEFPESAKTHFTSTSKVSDIKKLFADPQQAFVAGGGISPGGAPIKRLLVGAKSDSLCIIYYESGGFVLLDCIELYKLADNSCEKVWSNSMIAQHPKTMDELLKVVRDRTKQTDH